MYTVEANEWFDDAGWLEAMNYLPGLDHKDFWHMYCAGSEL